MPGVIAWLLYRKLLHLVAVLNLVYKDLGRLKTGYEVLVDDQRRIARNIAGYFLFPLLVNEATKAPDVDVVSVRHRRLYNAEESFNGCRYIRFVHSGLFSDFVNNVCFRHSVLFLGRYFFREGKFKICPQNLK